MSFVVVTGVPQAKVAVLRYRYVPGVAMLSLNVAAEPTRAVHDENRGPGALSQLYVGPAEAGVPVDADVVLVIFTVAPAQIFVPFIAPAAWVVE